jgi:hypothetical protein
MRRILIPVVPFLLLSCVSDPEPKPGTGWQEKKPAAFSYTYQRNCFCPPDWRGPFSVYADSVSVDSVFRRFAGGDGDSVAITENLQSYSIDSIRAELNAMLELDHDTAIVRYDSVYGFPASAYIDFNFQAADEEYGFTITDFRNLEN